MARTTPRKPPGVIEGNRSRLEARQELKRALDRDTAVQGERAEEGATTAHSPSSAGRAPSTARPAPPRKTRTK